MRNGRSLALAVSAALLVTFGRAEACSVAEWRPFVSKAPLIVVGTLGSIERYAFSRPDSMRGPQGVLHYLHYYDTGNVVVRDALKGELRSEHVLVRWYRAPWTVDGVRMSSSNEQHHEAGESGIWILMNRLESMGGSYNFIFLPSDSLNQVREAIQEPEDD